MLTSFQNSSTDRLTVNVAIKYSLNIHSRRTLNMSLSMGSRFLQERAILGGLSDSLNSFRGLCCGVCCKRDDSVLNEGMTARLLQPTAMLPMSHITFSPVKNPPPSYAAFRQNSSITCYFYLLVYLLTTSALMNIGAILHEFAYNLPLQRLVLV